MSNSEFDFKKHQNFSKSWKMLIRFLVYSVVISLLLFLIYYENKSKEELKKGSDIEQFDIEIDEVEMD